MPQCSLISEMASLSPIPTHSLRLLKRHCLLEYFSDNCFTKQVVVFLSSPSKACLFHYYASLIAQTVKCLLAMQGTQVQFLGWEDPLEKERETQSSILAWKIPWMGKPGKP